jgi:hypothetical protein
LVHILPRHGCLLLLFYNRSKMNKLGWPMRKQRLRQLILIRMFELLIHPWMFMR